MDQLFDRTVQVITWWGSSSFKNALPELCWKLSQGRKAWKKLAWLPFYDEVKLIESTLVFKRLQGSCPAYMYDLLKFNADLHTRTGRYNKLNLACPRFNRKTEGGRSFSVFATRLWNQLPINLKKKATTVAFFRKNFHRHFLSSCD